ncbi:MAG: glutamate racemase [Deltaproteobacteria bacterium]|jgi:glutamate racemase|nr:glutamate racemase [Deltaproteobacteria bacterium]
MDASLPVGVFDSGVGGLTVLRAMLRRLPHEDMLYLGDTARLPYGTKSSRTVARYAAQAASKLVERRIKLLVVACNTASAAALDDLQALWPELPVIGVVAPGAKAACAASRNGSIAVIATESTIGNQAYHAAIRGINPQARISAGACSLFVSLAEEGWLDGPIPEAVAERYLAPLFREAGPPAPDCLLLGCTHFPALLAPIRKVLGGETRIVDSAETTAEAVEEALFGLKALNPRSGPGQVSFMTTDDPPRFARIGAVFLGRPLSAREVELINL